MKLDKEYFQNRPLSHSFLSSYEYDPNQWYKKYILGEKEPPSKEMEFGSKVGKRIENDSTYLPMIKRLSKMEHAFNVMFDDIKMVGYADSFDDVSFKALKEFKTGKKAWTQKRVDKHKQIDMYLLMNYITNKIKPEDVDVTLVWMPTQDNGDFSISFVEPIEDNIKFFETKRTMTDILNFGVHIKKVVKEMQSYVDKRQG